ncbi:MAG: VWA containing CoxE family protein [Planctomycetota bacterium]|jgi:uncharacterized protein with von Willebrand factor type A (vWA) domain
MARDSDPSGTSPPDAGDHAGIFLSFFYRLRGRGLKVTPTQWLDLVEGLAKGLHGSSLIGFYSLARSILAKDETELDDFDQAFAIHFRGVEAQAASIEADVWRWLENPIAPYAVDPAWRKMLDEVDVEALRDAFEQRLREQKERHDGGGQWIGTGGTSPFGHSGYHPGGIRVGGEGRFGSAVQVAAERRYREHRRDLVLDTRQLGVALKKLRALKREGMAEELDVEGTIDCTARGGGELELVFQPPRANNLSLLLAMDVGGSMEPYRHLVDLLFSAAHGAQHFKRFDHVYFHNCVYDQVYEDAFFLDAIPLHQLFHRFDRETRLVFVGDAHMYPGELTDRWGAIQWQDRNEEPGAFYLQQLTSHFKHTAWLNPMKERMWFAPSVRMIRTLFPMYPLTIDGVENLAVQLAKT